MKDTENDADLSVPFHFKWCYQENGAIYSFEMAQDRLRWMIDTIAPLIILCF